LPDPGHYNEKIEAEGNYFYLYDDTSTGTRPSVNDQTGPWRLCNDFGVVITQGLFAEFAKMGKGIFSGDYFFSMNGRIFTSATNSIEKTAGATYTYNDVTKPAYTWFKGDPSEQTTYPYFEPNWWVDLLTGKMSAARGNFVVDDSGNVHLDNAYVRGEVHATSGVFTGEVHASSGDFTGSVYASNGKIGGFNIGTNSISTENEGKLQIGGQNFNTIFGVISMQKSIKVNDAINGIAFHNRDLPYKENNRLTLNNPNQAAYYNWENVTVANVMDIDYFPGWISTYQSQNTYGYQYAMLGRGHIGMDGIVEGGCLDNIDFEINDQVEFIKPPLYANRINIRTAYNNDVLILPDKYSIFSTLGCGVINDEVSQKFSFRMDIINGTDKEVFVSGRSNDSVSGFSLDNEALPYLYYWKVISDYSQESKYLDRRKSTKLNNLKINPHCVLSFMLVFDGNNYNAYELNTDLYNEIKVIFDG
jgi:hypothetical protein